MGEGVATDYRGGRRGVERLGAVRRLRQESTDAERRLWALIRSRQLTGAKFRRQHEVGPYILDFYCPAHRLAIEADGGQHFEPDGIQEDQERAKYLESCGVRVLRFTNVEIMGEAEGVIGRIQQALEETPSPSPSPTGRGDNLKYVIEPMQVAHIPAVSAIERQSFPSAWPASAYRREIERNQMAQYLIAKRTPAAGSVRRPRRFAIAAVDGQTETDGLLSRLSRFVRGEARAFSPEQAAELERVVGYGGVWTMVDLAHVTTIAVDPPYRGEGVGELLLVAMLERALALGAVEATLECRVSNQIAQALYRKYTFQDMGIRRSYYSDDGENALIMTTQPLDSAIFQEVLDHNRQKLMFRLSAEGERAHGSTGSP